MTPNSIAVCATGAAFANPTLSKDDSKPHVTAIKIPLVIFLDLFEVSINLSLSIPAFAVIATPINEITKPAIIYGNDG